MDHAGTLDKNEIPEDIEALESVSELVCRFTPALGPGLVVGSGRIVACHSRNTGVIEGIGRVFGGLQGARTGEAEFLGRDLAGVQGRQWRDWGWTSLAVVPPLQRPGQGSWGKWRISSRRELEGLLHRVMQDSRRGARLEAGILLGLMGSFIRGEPRLPDMDQVRSQTREIEGLGRPGTLEYQRLVQWAATTVCAPRLVVALEPFAGLGDQAARGLASCIKSLRREFGTAFLLCSREEGRAAGLADGVVDLDVREL